MCAGCGFASFGEALADLRAINEFEPVVQC